ncbi:MAG: hypothetical protein ACKO1M_03080 [Planctomycetota bacterium]
MWWTGARRTCERRRITRLEGRISTVSTTCSRAAAADSGRFFAARPPAAAVERASRTAATPSWEAVGREAGRRLEPGSATALLPAADRTLSRGFEACLVDFWAVCGPRDSDRAAGREADRCGGRQEMKRL